MALNRQLFIRSTFFLLGLFFISLGINITIASGFGTGGWDAANIGLVQHFGMSIGFWLNVWAIIYLILSALLEKKRIKIECLLTSFIIGFCVDGWNILFSQIHMQAMWTQFLMFLLGITTTSFGAGLYLVSDLPVNPIDYLMVVLTKSCSLSITIAKYIVEGSGLILGFVFGGPIGLGTVLMILLFGPMIQFWCERSEKALQYLLTCAT